MVIEQMRLWKKNLVLGYPLCKINTKRGQTNIIYWIIQKKISAKIIFRASKKSRIVIIWIKSGNEDIELFP
jgi:hypothetical protein